METLWPKSGDLGRGRIGVDGAADQGQGARLRLGEDLGQVGGGGQGQRRRLADRDDVHVRPQLLHEIDKVEGVVLDIELAFADGNVAGIVPVGDVDFAVGQQGHDRRAQERRVMTGHRRHQQHLAGLLLAALDLEVDQVAEGPFHHLGNADHMVAPVLAGHAVDPPVRLGDHALVSPFRNLAPGGHHGQHRVRHEREGRIGRETQRRRAHPLLGIAYGLHKVVACHEAHRYLLLAGQGPVCLRPRGLPGSAALTRPDLDLSHRGHRRSRRLMLQSRK